MVLGITCLLNTGKKPECINNRVLQYNTTYNMYFPWARITQFGVCITLHSFHMTGEIVLFSKMRHIKRI